ncbi:hypothetical protein [Lentzea nigeriaca]|uniref:hypothetical protein n=1 Tax=Lentzea nigeriaca TaxID=1128665 RepID=UPI00195726D5|nr:hypothetical protein [Lentzea nigeriaca]MBM7861797.1 hypothetical protein [Lentzea nigeriaca]
MPEPNSLLRAVREATASRQVAGARMSRRELAEAACAWLWETTRKRYPLDAHYIARIERGAVGVPSDHYRAALRAVLGVASDADIGFAVNNAAPVHTVVMPHPASANTVEEVLMSAADESAEFLAWAESTNVGEMTIEQMHAEVRRIAQSYLKAPTLPLFARTKALRDRAFTLLSGHQAPQLSRELYAAAGWSLTVLAWMSVDLGRPDAAEDHARAAWLCAERADYNPLRAWVRATQHTAALWQDDYIAAANYAADGLRYAAIGSAELYLASALALDLARAGDEDRARQALQRAQDAANRVVRAEDELTGPFTCTVGRAGSLWADAHLALGNTEEALSYADRAVATFEATPAALRNFGSERMTRLVQVKAHVVRGDMGAAEHTLGPVLETAPQHRVRPLLHRIAEVDVIAAQTAKPRDPIARRVRGSIAEFQRETVIKELSA